MVRFKGKKIISILEAISKTNLSAKSMQEKEEKNSISLIANNANAIQIISTNSKIDLAYKIDSDVEIFSPISAILNNSDLSKKLSLVIDSEEFITIANKEGNIVASGNGYVTLETEEPKTKRFKAIPSDKVVVSFIASDLVKAIYSTSLATDSSNATLSKVKICFNSEDATLKFIGFNGTLLCVYNIPLEDINENASSFSLLVDGKSLNALTDIIEEIKDDIVDIIVFDDSLAFSSNNLKIVLPTDNSEFVHCEKLLEETFDASVTFNVNYLKKTLNSIYKVSKENLCFESDGTNHKLLSTNFSKPVNVVRSSAIKFTLPISLMKSLVLSIKETNIVFSLSEKKLVKVSSEMSDDIIFITTVCKEGNS